ncbi:MAG: 50S ribosomal protein L28 [bacterium]|nr:50S ribosomal protein L28 [bacterium]
MARICGICGKKPITGHRVSHSNRKTKRRWLPNIHKTRVLIDKTIKYIYVCTRCLRSGKVQKVV